MFQKEPLSLESKEPAVQDGKTVMLFENCIYIYIYLNVCIWEEFVVVSIYSTHLLFC